MNEKLKAVPVSPAIPSPFLERMARLLGDEYETFLAAYQESSRIGLRANTLKVKPEVLRKIVPFQLEPLSDIHAAFLVNDDARAGMHPYHAAGLYYLQEPSAMVVTELLAPQPGEWVLDLSAAPGGKATHITSKMDNKGLFIANEIHAKRVWDLAENLERWGVANTAIINEAPERIAHHFADLFDRVLVDAPCSGEALFRKEESARAEWTPEVVSGAAIRQQAILEQAVQVVRPGGRLVYSTCTFAPDENEAVVAWLLSSYPSFELEVVTERRGFSPGRPDWIREPNLPELSRTVRLWPHHWPGEGHFIAVLRRMTPVGRVEPVTNGLFDYDAVLPRAALKAYHAFCHENLTAVIGDDQLALEGTYLYELPRSLPHLGSLRVIHPGRWLGIIRKHRFEPSHALALSLNIGDVQRTLELAPDSVEVLSYLRGQTLRSPGEDGWVLITVSGFPLGWGKRVKGVVKNHYPKGLRWL